MEDVGVELEQLAVPNGLHRRRSRRPRQQGELADGRARPELTDGFGAVLPVDDDTQPPAADEEESIGAVTLPDDDVAGADRDEPQAGVQSIERRCVHARKQRYVREQRLGADSPRSDHGQR